MFDSDSDVKTNMWMRTMRWKRLLDIGQPKIFEKENYCIYGK